jgi:hypothetical protein
VSAELGSTVCGQRCELEHGIGIAGSDCVVDNPSQSPVVAAGEQPREHLSVQHGPPRGGDVGLDRAARKLVAEAQAEAVGHEHAAPLALVDVALGISAHRQQKFELDVKRNDGGGFEDGATAC